ncbi:MAG: M50 family metallopeptidase [bacterium]|nr:M50 family metallopeptidase [bacterium]
MEIFIFIVVIVALIVVHEFGHLVAAKLSGMRVDEFGLGYPPRAATIGHVGETAITLNWLPLGGFVKIYGEDGTETGPRDPRAFGRRPRILQALVLVAGVAMNLFFAYVLITSALIAGMPRALAPEEVSRATDTALAVSGVLPGSPAARAGFAESDTIISATDANGSWRASDPASFSDFVAASGGPSGTRDLRPITLTIKHNGQEQTLTVTPVAGLVASDESRYALGIEVATIGVVPLSLGQAIVEGAQLTWSATLLTAAGLWHFFYGIVTGHADLSQVAGPVGIAGVVGSASMDGLGALLSIVAIISINLALINLIPVPALDGGRLLFVIIESIVRRPIKPSVARAMNAASFVLLILLMLVVTAHDIYRIVG